jgi:hypothetical protein
MGVRRGDYSPRLKWIEVKTRLNHGEVQRLRFNSWGRTAIKMDGDTAQAPEMELDMARAQRERVLVWLVDWGLVDERDKPVRITAAAIDNLDPQVAEEIDAVLTAHIEEMEAVKNE